MAAKRDICGFTREGVRRDIKALKRPSTEDITKSSVREAEKMERLKKQVRCQAKKLTLLRRGLRVFARAGSWQHEFPSRARVITREWNRVEDPWDLADRVLKEERAIK